MAKKRQTTFAKLQKERARREKQAAKRERRQGKRDDALTPGDPTTTGLYFGADAPDVDLDLGAEAQPDAEHDGEPVVDAD